MEDRYAADRRGQRREQAALLDVHVRVDECDVSQLSQLGLFCGFFQYALADLHANKVLLASKLLGHRVQILATRATNVQMDRKLRLSKDLAPHRQRDGLPVLLRQRIHMLADALGCKGLRSCWIGSYAQLSNQHRNTSAANAARRLTRNCSQHRRSAVRVPTPVMVSMPIELVHQQAHATQPNVGKAGTPLSVPNDVTPRGEEVRLPARKVRTTLITIGIFFPSTQRTAEDARMLLVMALAAMDENASGVVRDVYGRETRSQVELGGHKSMSEWKQSLHNGFEIWWLAGMPLVMVFLLTLLSMSVVSGISGLEEKSLTFKLSIPLPGFVWKTASKLSGGWLGKGSTAHRPAVAAADQRSNRLDGVKIPRHIAVIMDGNRRYGKATYGAGVRGHSDGSKTLVNFTDWCIEAGVQALTVYAFSTENWNREKAEVDALMSLFKEFMHQIVPEALQRNIRVRCLVSDGRKFPLDIVAAIEEIESKTKHCNGFNLNICVSYGARDEIANACRAIATKVANGSACVDDINEDFVGQHMLTAELPDPDVLVRTSGELRISNFLLYQIAYSELIFLDKNWPEVTREDLYEHIILEFSRRKRRFGK